MWMQDRRPAATPATARTSGAASDARDRSSDVLERPLAAVVNAVSSLLRVRQQGQFGLLVCG
jgi:hypothetical protein